MESPPIDGIERASEKGKLSRDDMHCTCLSERAVEMGGAWAGVERRSMSLAASKDMAAGEGRCNQQRGKKHAKAWCLDGWPLDDGCCVRFAVCGLLSALPGVRQARLKAAMHER